MCPAADPTDPSPDRHGFPGPARWPGQGVARHENGCKMRNYTSAPGTESRRGVHWTGPFHWHPEPFIVTPSPFIVTPSRARGLLPAAGRKVLAFLGVLLTKHFGFLAPLEMTDMGRMTDVGREDMGRKKMWAVRRYAPCEDMGRKNRPGPVRGGRRPGQGQMKRRRFTGGRCKTGRGLFIVTPSRAVCRLPGGRQAWAGRRGAGWDLFFRWNK